MPSLRRAGLVAAAAALPLALAYRFAVIYTGRAGHPRQRPPRFTPVDFGLDFEAIEIPAPHGSLPGWFIPGNHGRRGPGVVLVHGWESARDRALPNVRFLHEAGFHCLVFDVRGHGINPPDPLPISAGEFAADASAGLDALAARPEVSRAAVFGHSIGGSGGIVAASTNPNAAALVSVSAPSDPQRLTRQTFRLANLPLPDPIAYPLAWLTTRVYLRPRGHSVEDISARAAIARYRGPVLLTHGALDTIVPVSHLMRLARAAGDARRRPGHGPLEVYVVPEGRHSWLHEDAEFRRTVARFLAESLGGPFSPDDAGQRAFAIDCPRLPETEPGFSAVVDAPSRTRTFGEVTGASRLLGRRR